MTRSLAQAGTRRVVAGDLTTPISFERLLSAPDSYGGTTKTWQHAFDAWSFPEPLFVGEREQLGAMRNVTTYRFTVYADSHVNEQMRITWDGVAYAIKGIRRGGSSELFMDIIAETGLGD